MPGIRAWVGTHLSRSKEHIRGKQWGKCHLPSPTGGEILYYNITMHLSCENVVIFVIFVLGNALAFR